MFRVPFLRADRFHASRNALKGGIALLLASCASFSPATTMSSLDNGQVRVGVDLDHGGTISHLSAPPGGENLINTFDLGRQVQQSYYSGPQPFGNPHPSWPNWPWNPIGTGDVYGNPSRVLEHRNNGKTLYVKSIPMQWALNNVPGKCTFETWIRLEGSAVHVQNRLKNHRPDRTRYPAKDQELPAVYTIGKLHRLFTYEGAAPFTAAPASQITNSGPPWSSWRATENWAALLNDDDWGLGVYHPGVYRFIGGFHGKPNTGGSKDGSTGYIAPIRQEILDHNITYTYEYTLIPGSLKEIRSYVMKHRSKRGKPDYSFERDRQHWIYRNASDAGFPFKGWLQVNLDGPDPQMLGPEGWWKAEDVPRLYVRAAHHTKLNRAELYWKTLDEDGFHESRKVEFEVKPDGKFHTYEIKLAEHPSYRGILTGLRLDPAVGGKSGDYVRIQSISWKKPKR